MVDVLHYRVHLDNAYCRVVAELAAQVEPWPWPERLMLADRGIEATRTDRNGPPFSMLASAVIEGLGRPPVDNFHVAARHYLSDVEQWRWAGHAWCDANGYGPLLVEFQLGPGAFVEFEATGRLAPWLDSAGMHVSMVN